jgi:hypothetical protein
MTTKLNTQIVTTTFNMSSTTYQPGGHFKLEVPQSSAVIAKPVSYDFRVAEYVDEDGKISKVGLQYRMWEHDNDGTGTVVQTWTDVERVQIPTYLV